MSLHTILDLIKEKEAIRIRVRNDETGEWFSFPVSIKDLEEVIYEAN